MNLENNIFFQSLKTPYIKTCIELHIKDYVSAYNLDAVALKKAFLVNLGKGNIKRKKLIEDNQKLIDNPSISEYEKELYRYSNQILEFIVDPQNNKLAMLLLTIYFMHKDYIKAVIFDKFYYSPQIQQAIKDLIEQMDFFAFTYFSKDKIISSLIILLYTLLVDIEKYNKSEAIKFIEFIVNTQFKKVDIPTNIRSDYYEKHPIYCAGIYNELPIFMTYTGKEEHYYNDEDLEKIQKFFEYFLNNKDLITILNSLDKTKKKADLFRETLYNKTLLHEAINNLYTYYALHPTSFIHLHRKKIEKSYPRTIFKHPIIWIKALISTILTNLYTKLTR